MAEASPARRNKANDSSESEKEDENVSELLAKNRKITKMRQKRMQEKADKEAKRAEEMKKWIDEQDKKRKEDMDSIVNQRQRAIQERQEGLKKKREEREQFRRKYLEDNKPQAGNYVYKRMEKEFHERVELPEIRRQQDAIQQRRREIRSVDISRLQKEGELAVLEQQARHEQMRARNSYSAADASTSDFKPKYISKFHERIEREKEERLRQEQEREQRKLEALRRRQQYGRAVRDIFIPTTDERLQLELEDRVRRLDAMKKSVLAKMEAGQNNPLARVDLSSVFADRARPQENTGRSSQMSYYSSQYEHPYGRVPYRRGQPQFWSP